MSLMKELLFAVEQKTWLTTILPLFFTVYLLSWIIYARTLHPFLKVPRDFWPSVLRTWHMYRIYKGDLTDHMQDIHKRHGPLVRIAPNKVLSADLEAIAKIYST